MKAAIIIRRIGPYHAARLRALVDAVEGQICAIEVVERDSTYDWEMVQDIGAADRRTLFSSETEEEVGLLFQRMFETLDAVQPRVVAVPGWGDPAALAALAWCHKHRIPAILMSDSTIHDAPRKRWREWNKRAIVHLSDSALVAGNPHRAYLKTLGMPKSRIVTGYDVVDNAYFAQGADISRLEAPRLRAQLNLPERYLLSVCRFVEKKNLVRLLEAQAELRDRFPSATIPLVLVGAGPLAHTLKLRIAQLDLAGHVFIMPFARYEALPVFYGLAEGFVLASTVDQWGLVINEAMAAGIPVLVSSQCGAVEDLVIEGQTGFVINPFSTSEIAYGLLRLSRLDGAARVRMGQAARAIIADWGPERFATAFNQAAALAMQHHPCRNRILASKLFLKAVAHSLVKSRTKCMSYAVFLAAIAFFC